MPSNKINVTIFEDSHHNDEGSLPTHWIPPVVGICGCERLLSRPDGSLEGRLGGINLPRAPRTASQRVRGPRGSTTALARLIEWLDTFVQLPAKTVNPAHSADNRQRHEVVGQTARSLYLEEPRGPCVRLGWGQRRAAF